MKTRHFTAVSSEFEKKLYAKPAVVINYVSSKESRLTTAQELIDSLGLSVVFDETLGHATLVDSRGEYACHPERRNKPVWWETVEQAQQEIAENYLDFYYDYREYHMTSLTKAVWCEDFEDYDDGFNIYSAVWLNNHQDFHDFTLADDLVSMAIHWRKNREEILSELDVYSNHKVTPAVEDITSDTKDEDIIFATDDDGAHISLRTLLEIAEDYFNLPADYQNYTTQLIIAHNMWLGHYNND